MEKRDGDGGVSACLITHGTVRATCVASRTPSYFSLFLASSRLPATSFCVFIVYSSSRAAPQSRLFFHVYALIFDAVLEKIVAAAFQRDLWRLKDPYVTWISSIFTRNERNAKITAVPMDTETSRRPPLLPAPHPAIRPNEQEVSRK
jgi:hypothetical protein